MRISTIMLMSWVEGYGIRMFVLRSVNHILFITRPLVSCHGSDVVGCAQPSERSARRIACPYRAVLASDATPRCASMASADRQMSGDATPGPCAPQTSLHMLANRHTAPCLQQTRHIRIVRILAIDRVGDDQHLAHSRADHH